MGELIYNQKDIPANRWRYGLRTSAKTGCGWIALYNALVLLGEDPDPEELIHRCERQLPVINGNAGTVVWSPLLLLKKRGYRVRTALLPNRFDSLCRESDACILFYYWRRKLRVGAHFAALHWTKDGILGYNTYSNSTGPDRYGSSLEDFLKEKHYFPAVLMGITKR